MRTRATSAPLELAVLLDDDSSSEEETPLPEARVRCCDAAGALLEDLGTRRGSLWLGVTSAGEPCAAMTARFEATLDGYCELREPEVFHLAAKARDSVGGGSSEYEVIKVVLRLRRVLFGVVVLAQGEPIADAKVSLASLCANSAAADSSADEREVDSQTLAWCARRKCYCEACVQRQFVRFRIFKGWVLRVD